MVSLPDGKIISKIPLFVLAQLRNVTVTDRQTDGRTPGNGNSRAMHSIARQKSPFSRTAAHIYVSPGDAPAIITQYVAWVERQFDACQTSRCMYLPLYLQQFPSYTMVKSMRKSKNRYFHHIFVSLGTPLGQSR